MTVALCMFALWAWGGWISWKGIENGNGWIGAILSEKIRKSLNKKENWKTGGKRRFFRRHSAMLQWVQR